MTMELAHVFKLEGEKIRRFGGVLPSQ
jgi:hypothetical protein